jgi:hypothetical protein
MALDSTNDRRERQINPAFGHFHKIAKAEFVPQIPATQRMAISQSKWRSLKGSTLSVLASFAILPVYRRNM